MYTDFLTKIKNAQQAKHLSLKTGYSKMDLKIAEVLSKYGFIKEVSKKGRLPKRIIEVELKYDKEGNGGISGLKFVSIPSRKIYSGYKDLRNVKQGYGISVVSTPSGVMAGVEARKKKLGGQVLFEIW
jgi:small subunit ribosomal protein S8